ncbi:MAG: hypothetical protein AAF950_08740 [Pseudomonadota bacterium]
MTQRDMSRPTTTESSAEDFEKLNKTGQWLGWAGFVCALLWWGGVAGILVGLFGVEQLLQQSTGILIAAGALILLPGLMMTLAGLMARQNRRATEANVLVMRAAETLLSPAQIAGTDIQKLAATTKAYTDAINQTASDTLSALKAAADVLENERLRVESVSYAMSDNARDLTVRLKEERHAIESIAKSLDLQTRSMSDAIPRQAAAIAKAAQEASEEIADADLGLEKQLRQLKHAGSTLAVRLTDLETIAKDASSRTEVLNQSLGRVEAKLGESQKTIEMAERASSMAVDAASGAGNALRDAVSAALDSAREANLEITQTTRKVHEDAARTLADLRQASVEAGAAAEDTGKALRATLNAQHTASPAPQSQAPRSQEQPTQAPKDTPLNGASGRPADHGSLRGRTDMNGASPAFEKESSREPEQPLRPQSRENPLPSPSAPTASDEDLFDLEEAAAPVIRTQEPIKPNDHSAPDLNGVGANGHDSTEWRDIIADLADDEAKQGDVPRTEAPLARDTTADTLIDRLESSGIPLPKTFKPRDKKRIAAAARKDEKARRAAIRQAAGNEVDRVALRLRKDADLLRLAQHFIMAEEPDALLALDKTSHSKRPASPRLSAYLLVDAALENISAP